MKVSLVKAKVYTRWILFALTLVFIITGFGITQYQIVEKLTGGLLSKALSFKIHDNIIIPFVIFLILHIYLSIVSRRVKN